MKKGIFITFEGIEGSGKSTQIKKLAHYFKTNQVTYCVTKEPGGTPFGKKIREILLNPETRFSSRYTELLLFYIDRLENVAQNIEPALSKGQVVLCDRYIDSSIAYQKGARNMPPSLLNTLNKLVGLQPDLTILFDIEPEEGLKRALSRSKKDRFELEHILFHQHVRKAYLAQAVKEPARIKVIKIENLDPDQVFERVLTLIHARGI